MTRQVLLVVLVSLAAVACSRGGAQPSPEPEPMVVRAVAVADQDIVVPIVATGTLGAKEEIALSFKIGGVIARIAVDGGERVHAGQLLATLDTREIDAAVARAQAATDKAERDLARAQRLYADSVVSKSQLEDAGTAAEIARADLAAVRFNRRYAIITAPGDGVILSRHAESGETVAPGSAILDFGSLTRGSVLRVGLADRDAVRVRPGDVATVRFDALPDQTFDGRVTRVAAAAEPGTGTYEIEVSVPRATTLVSGLVGKAQIRPSAGTRARVIPIEALLEADGSTAIVFALSADGARAERRQVTVAFIEGDQVAVTGGLEGVHSVLTDGAAYLNDGSVVRVVQ